MIPALLGASALAARTALTFTVGAARTAGRIVGAPAAVARPTVQILREAVDLGSAASRRSWTGPGRVHLDVRLPPDAAARGVAAERIAAELRAVDEVRDAWVDPGLGRAIVHVEPDAVDSTALAARIRDVESTFSDRSESDATESDRSEDGCRIPSPGDAGPVREQALAFAASSAGLVGALSGRLARLPAMSPLLTAPVVLVDNQPRLRALLERRLGPAGADFSLALATAAVQGLGGATSSLAVDAAVRAQSLLAAQARRRCFAAREPELCARGRPVRARAEGMPRPQTLPQGPVERLADRAAAGSLLAAGLLGALTASPSNAARAVLVGAPKAARVAQQSFGDALTNGLSRQGIVIVDPSALRALDRVSTVVIDGAALLGQRPLVVGATATAEHWTDDHVWSAGQRLLQGERTLDIPPPHGRSGARLRLVGGDVEAGRGLSEMLLTEDGETVGTLLVGREVDPYGTAILTAARRAGRLVLAADASAAGLSNLADRVLSLGEDPDGDLVAEIRTLQSQGAVVAVVTGEPAALAAADVAIGVTDSSRPVPWDADVLCRPGKVTDAARILDAAAAAAAVSQRGVTLAVGGSFLGALLTAVGRTRRGAATFPVNAAAASGLTTGWLGARRVLRAPDPPTIPQVPWHALEADDVLDRLHTVGAATDGAGPEPDHLTAALASRRLPGPVRATVRLVDNVRAELADPLTPVLGTGAAASAVIGSPSDALLVSGVLVANALVSGAQRLRADNALRSLLEEQRPLARVADCPHGTALAGPRTVPADRLRPGDVLELRAGDVVPADSRILEVDDLEVDESSLTGESGAVLKQTAATPSADLPDRACMVYEGTTVLAGTGRAVVVATGAATESGRALQLARSSSTATGMQARLEEITRRGLPVTLVGGAAVTALGLLRGQRLRSALASGVSVAVAAVPEGLPLVATVAQASAGRRLSQRGVLVRSGRTLEALGRVDTVCFDKTGTLTEGRLHLVRVAGPEQQWAPDDPRARRVLQAAAQACPQPVPDRPFTHATDQAIVEGATEVLGSELARGWNELDEVPFQSDRGYSAALGRRGQRLRLVIKGAPEVLLPRCTHVRDDDGKRRLDNAKRSEAERLMRTLAADGLRVLAVARRGVPEEVAEDTDEVADLAEDLTFLGFVALADVPRPEAEPTVAALRQARLGTVMITGDHPVTARTIAASLGIPADRVVTGADLDQASEDERVRIVAEASVFARVSPEQKLRIVAALQRSGRVVAMTGDGANDAAAIRLADVGIGMTARGSTSARTAADLVLTDPDISVLLDALVEGRALWRRVRDAVAILLGGNAGEVGFTLLGTALAGRAPISTRQFLLVNMLTDLLPAMAIGLAATPDDPEERRRILVQGRPSLGAPLLRDIGVRGGTTAAGALAAWQIGRFTGTRGRADTMALTALVATQLGQTLVVGRSNPLVMITGLGSFAALAGIVQIPPISRFFGCRPLGPVAWTTVIASAAGATALSVVVPRLLGRQPDGGEAPREFDGELVRVPAMEEVSHG